MVERGRRAGLLTYPGENGARGVDRETDQPARVDWALGHAAVHQRFGEGDLASILAANLDPATPAARQASEDKSLTQGTAGWAALGTTTPNTTTPSTTTISRVDLNGHNDSHDPEDNR